MAAAAGLRRFPVLGSLLAAGLVGTSLAPATLAAEGVSITSYGHSALLIRGGGASVLINPFKAVACAAGLAEPRVRADVILASSRLLDEGAPVASGRMLVTPGSYRVAGLQIEGIAAPTTGSAAGASGRRRCGAGSRAG